MKNLLIHVSPNKYFCNEEHKNSAKIQIDNSLRLNWKVEDILLATNFNYEYRGVKAVLIGDDNYCTYWWPLTKIYSIVKLFKMGLIEDNLYWYHDFDCFQLNPFTDIEKDMGAAEFGLTNYGRMPRLCSASMFFKKSAEDIFDRIKQYCDKKKVQEEPGMASMINADELLQKRIKRLNTTYAFQKWNMWHSYCRSDKPIKAVHFHLTPDKYDFFIKGNNPVGLRIVPEGLIKIFNKYGFNRD